MRSKVKNYLYRKQGRDQKVWKQLNDGSLGFYTCLFQQEENTL